MHKAAFKSTAFLFLVLAGVLVSQVATASSTACTGAAPKCRRTTSTWTTSTTKTSRTTTSTTTTSTTTTSTTTTSTSSTTTTTTQTSSALPYRYMFNTSGSGTPAATYGWKLVA